MPASHGPLPLTHPGAQAIPLSIATVFGASTYSALGNYIWQKHPVVKHRHQIAYDVVLVLLPSTLLGSTAGVFLNKVCPNWLIMLQHVHCMCTACALHAHCMCTACLLPGLPQLADHAAARAPMRLLGQAHAEQGLPTVGQAAQTRTPP
eukprot:scaffold118212_cov48-Phaeocystis_antarctica.AAC.1